MRTLAIVSLAILAAIAAAAQSPPSNTPPPAPAPVAQPPEAPANQPAPLATPKVTDERTGSLNPRAANDRKKIDPIEASVSRLDVRLKLTDDQKSKIKVILKDERDQVLALRGNKTLTNQQVIEKQRALHAETDQKVRGVLTPEQLEKYQRPKPAGMNKTPPSSANQPGAPGVQPAPQAAPATPPPSDSK
jgi:Spy/CpxP family protein refolding chaperone